MRNILGFNLCLGNCTSLQAILNPDSRPSSVVRVDRHLFLLFQDHRNFFGHLELLVQLGPFFDPFHTTLDLYCSAGLSLTAIVCCRLLFRPRSSSSHKYPQAQGRLFTPSSSHTTISLHSTTSTIHTHSFPATLHLLARFLFDYSHHFPTISTL